MHVVKVFLDGITPYLPRNRYRQPAKNPKTSPAPFLSTMLVCSRATSRNTTKLPHQHHLSYQRERSIWLDHGLEGLSARNSEILLPRPSEPIFQHAPWSLSSQPTNSVQTTGPTPTHGPNVTADMTRSRSGSQIEAIYGIFPFCGPPTDLGGWNMSILDPHSEFGYISYTVFHLWT